MSVRYPSCTCRYIDSSGALPCLVKREAYAVATASFLAIDAGEIAFPKTEIMEMLDLEGCDLLVVDGGGIIYRSINRRRAAASDMVGGVIGDGWWWAQTQWRPALQTGELDWGHMYWLEIWQFHARWEFYFGLPFTYCLTRLMKCSWKEYCWRCWSRSGVCSLTVRVRMLDLSRVPAQMRGGAVSRAGRASTPNV